MGLVVAAAGIAGGRICAQAQFPYWPLYTTVLACVIYPTVYHWVWTPVGFMSVYSSGTVLPMLDFGGAVCLHVPVLFRLRVHARACACVCVCAFGT